MVVLPVWMEPTVPLTCVEEELSDSHVCRGRNVSSSAAIRGDKGLAQYLNVSLL